MELTAINRLCVSIYHRGITIGQSVPTLSTVCYDRLLCFYEKHLPNNVSLFPPLIMFGMVLFELVAGAGFEPATFGL